MQQSLSKRLLYTVVLNALAYPAIAQDGNNIEVIEVYAQKRAQSLNEVSIAVTPIDAETMSRSGIKDTTELGRFVTNMKVSQNAAEGTPPAVNIRGVGLLDYNTANTSPVATYIDGASVGSANNQLVNFFDIEQVEVLKGPQGTLFGRNSTGGAVLIRSKRPDSGTYGAVTVGIGSDDWSKVQGYFNASLNENSAIRLAASQVDYEYTSYNLHPTAPEANMKQSDLRLSYLGEWDNLSIYLKANYSHWDGIVQPVGNIGVADLVNGVVCSAEKAAAGQCTDNFGFNDGSDDFWAVNVNNDSPHLSIGKGWTAEVTYSPSEKEDVVWINAFSRLDRRHAFNCDGSPADLCEGNLGLKAELLTNELRHHLDVDSGYLTAGLFQLQERIYQDNYNDILRDLRVVPLYWGNTKTYFYDNEIISKVYAAFAQYEWQWLESTSVTFGLRYSDEAVDYDSISTTNVVEDINNLDGVIRPFYDVAGRIDDDGISGKVSINHTLSNNGLLYYSFANGKKSGGYNGGLLSSPEQAREAHYGAESLHAHELGAKLFYPKQSLSVNSSVFYYDYRDQQVFMNQPSNIAGSVPVQLLKNVADSTIYGLETDIKFDLNTHLSTQLGVGYIPHAQFKEYVDPTGFSLTDKQLPFTSEWNINGEVVYVISMGSADITTRLGFDYQSEYYFDQQQTDYAKQDSFVLWHLSTQYDADKWMVSLWAKNLFDEEYSNLKFDLRNFLGMLEDFKGEGRRLGLDVSYRF